MKFLSILAGALAFGSALAAPLSGPDSDTTQLVARGRSKGYKYKLSAPPKVGGTGVSEDAKKKLTFIHYGDDVKTHGSHVEYHHTQYPEHKGKGFAVAGGNGKAGEVNNNRKAALRGIATLGPNWVRDEKPLASLSHGAKKTTVMKVPNAESRIEASLARIAKQSALDKGHKVVLVDNRSVKNTGPLGKLLKKRDLEALQARGLLSGLTDKLGDKINEGEQHLDDKVDGLKNKTESLTDGKLSDKFDSEIAKLEQKLAPLLSKVTDSFKDAGEDLVTAVEQLLFGSGHSMSPFYFGMNNFDDVQEGQQASGVKLSDEDLAHDQAAIDVYMSGFSNATAAVGEKIMGDFYKVIDLIVGDTGVDGSATAASLFGTGGWSDKDATLNGEGADAKTNDSSSAPAELQATTSAEATSGAEVTATADATATAVAVGYKF